MPMYEYICEEDGETITLLRTMKDADATVDDPRGDGRHFVRTHSTFQVGPSAGTGGPPPAFGSGCPCGNPNGPCNG